MLPLKELLNHGQSIWYDNVERGLIRSGAMKDLVDVGVRGVTSNPTIFEKAIVGTSHYDDAVMEVRKDGGTVDALYDHLVFEDIRSVADLLVPVHQSSQGVDGYVSLEVSPKLSNDTAGTVKEALRLQGALERDNLMIKVPATAAGIVAIRKLIEKGVNVNVTLIFGLAQYTDVLEAYVAGLEARKAAGLSLDVASVASFFVSRVDSLIDGRLDKLASSAAKELQGKAAIANAKMAYKHFAEVSDSPRWQVLAAAGAKVQRPLWASTGTKNPAYPPLLYITELVGADTVNTVPPATLEHIFKAGGFSSTIDKDVDDAKQLIRQIEALGISMAEVEATLLSQGLASFEASFNALMSVLAERLVGK